MKSVKIKRAVGEALVLDVKSRIKYSDLSTIATAIHNDVFSDEGYCPYMKNLGLVYYVMRYYAGYTFEDADEMMELFASGALSVVYSVIDAQQLKLLEQLVDDMIDYTRGKTGLDQLCGMLLREMRKKAPENAQAQE